jgi:hypothetical protein
MGDGVTGSVNAPANQTTNAGRNGASSAADTAAQAEFGKALKHENPCPEGLSRRPHDGCTYLRDPSQSVDLKFHGDPDRLKGPMNRSNGPDYSKPIPQLPSTSLKLPDGPYHSGGLGSGDGAHIGGWGGKF